MMKKYPRKIKKMLIENDYFQLSKNERINDIKKVFNRLESIENKNNIKRKFNELRGRKFNE